MHKPTILIKRDLNHLKAKRAMQEKVVAYVL